MQLHTTLKSYYCKKELSWTFNQQKPKIFCHIPGAHPGPVVVLINIISVLWKLKHSLL